MGAALYIVIENQPDGFDAFVNGKALSKASGRLSAAAKKIGVRELMNFFSADPGEFEGLVGEETPELPAEQWFAAADGLVTVRALVAHFTSNSSPADSAIIAELREFESVLQRVQERGLRWHLSVDY